MLQNLFDLLNTMHRASFFYKKIMELLSVNTENLRLIWQRDLECEISKEKWHNWEMVDAALNVHIQIISLLSRLHICICTTASGILPIGESAVHVLRNYRYMIADWLVSNQSHTSHSPERCSTELWLLPLWSLLQQRRHKHCSQSPNMAERAETLDGRSGLGPPLMHPGAFSALCCLVLDQRAA